MLAKRTFGSNVEGLALRVVCVMRIGGSPLTASDSDQRLYVASWDYGTVQCSRIRRLALRSECGSAGG